MKPWKALLVLILVLVLFGAIFGVIEGLVGGNLKGNLVVEPGNVEVRFCPVEDCERILLDEIGKASEVECAFYDLDLETLSELLESKDANVLVYEENFDGSFTSVGSEGLMHHKFCVLDDSRVITGSTNPTENGAKFNDNNLLVIESATIARRFSAEFSQIESGNKKRVPPRYVQLDDVLIQLLFCPQENCEQTVLREISKSEHSIQFMTFSFTSDAIGDSLLSASDRGVTVSGVFEARMNPSYSEYQKLLDYGLDVSIDNNPKTMHHKVFIIDNSTVITGSYNPSWSASERNDENLLVIYSQKIAEEYLKEYERVKK